MRRNWPFFKDSDWLILVFVDSAKPTAQIENPALSPSLSSLGLSNETKFVHIRWELRSSLVGDTILGVQSGPACIMCLMRVKSRRVSLKRWFDVKYSSCRQTSCLLGVLHWKLPRNITTLMWTTIVYSLSQVADHPMSSPCWVDKAGPVLAFRTMHLNDVVSASSPMIPLDIKYSTHLV